MKIRFSAVIMTCFLSISTGSLLNAQTKIWSVDECIQYALQKNIQIQQAQVSNDIYGLDLTYAKSAWYPSLSGSARQNFSWSNQTNNTTGPLYSRVLMERISH